MQRGGSPGPLIHHFGGHGGGQGHPAFWFLALVVLAAVFFLAVWSLMRASARGPAQVAAAGATAGDAAIDSVRLRYARGEIDRDTFTQISADLGAPPPA
ncbi:MAG TPA: hypothetical protein VGM80_18120 [Gaiellaceae bacterium]